MGNGRMATEKSRCGRLRRTLAVAAVLAVALGQPRAMLAQATSEAAPPATAPATAPSGIITPATRPNNNGERSVTTQPGGGLLLNFREATIDSVLDELSASAGFSIVKSVRTEGRVSLVAKQAVSPEQAVALLNSVLNEKGYAAIKQGTILKIVMKDQARHAAIPVRTGSDPSKIDPTDELITQVIPLRYANATQLRQDLTPLVNPTADFAANASSNALVMTDTAANIRRVVEIVNSLDTHLADATEVKVFPLRYASAASAARLINELFRNVGTTGGGGQQGQQQGQGGFGGRFGGFGPGAFGPGAFGGGNFQGGGGRGNQQQQQQQQQGGMRNTPVNASSDDRTNTLVVTGPTDVLETVARVVRDLDNNPTSDETVFIYKLKNADALNVESVINMLFNGTSGTNRGSTQNRQQTLSANRTGIGSSSRTGTGTGTGFGGRTTGGFGGTGAFGGTGGFGAFAQGVGGQRGTGGFLGIGGVSTGAARIASDLAGQVTIIADPDTNSLLVRTAPGNYDRVKEVLAELDRPVAQVLIKVLIAEVTHDNTTDMGVEWSILNMRASGNGQEGGTSFNIPVNGPAATGLVVQILEGDFTATIRALETNGKLDVLSRPYILASDNQLASITVGQEVPFITRTQLTDTGTTNNTIEYSDIGILLDVVPHINPDGLVILDVAPEISALTGTSVPISETVSAPVFAKRSAQSRVGVQNGQTIVIGGLMEDRKTETIDKVPIVGDIPYLGELFKRRRNTKTKTELLIFLTPHVASRPEMLQDMAGEELRGTKLVPGAVDTGAFQLHQEGLQSGHGPTTRPEPPPAEE